MFFSAQTPISHFLKEYSGVIRCPQCGEASLLETGIDELDKYVAEEEEVELENGGPANGKRNSRNSGEEDTEPNVSLLFNRMRIKTLSSAV